MIRIKSIFDTPYDEFMNKINKVYGTIFLAIRKLGIVPYNQLDYTLPSEVARMYQLIETSY